MAPRTVVFVHGMFMTPLCWEHWLTRFDAKGYRCVALAWPGRDRPVAELHASPPDPALTSLTLADVVAHAAATVAALEGTPIVIGHSTGGLVAQILVNRDVVAAGVAIHSTPPAGVSTLKLPFLRAGWSIANPFSNQSQPKTLAFEEFQYAFANTLPLDSQQAAFGRYVVPESRRIAGESLRPVARIDFTKPHRPLLIIAGVQDRVAPASLNFNNFARYRHLASITDFQAFDGRDHLVILEPAWEEVADFVADWLKHHDA